jgi:Fanconi-associated nuclease 1
MNIVLTFKLLLWSCLCNLTAVCFLAGGFSIDQALGVAQAMDMALEINDLTKAMGFLERARIHLQMDQARNSSHNGTAPSFLSHFSAAQVYSTVCTLGVSILEREHKYTEAVELLKELLCIRYKSGRRGYWTVRLSTDLDHLGRKEESLQVAEAGVNDCCIRGGDRLALQRRVVRLSKPPRRWRRPAYAASLERKWEEVHIP